MKNVMMFGTALFVIAPLMAQASCESVKADISQKIINNGVPESGFKLEVVPNDQTQKAGGQVVGHCENDTYKILYTRGSDRVAAITANFQATTSIGNLVSISSSNIP